MRYLFPILLLTACANTQTAAWNKTEGRASAWQEEDVRDGNHGPNRKLAGDNPLGRTHELFGDCTRKTLREALDWGTYPSTYTQVEATSYDMPNESNVKLPKNATKMQVVYITRYAAKEGLQYGSEKQPKYHVGDVVETDAVQMLLEDGTNKNDCKIIDTKSLSKEEAEAAKPANAHPYFQDACALLAVNTAAKYFIFHDPAKNELPGNQNTELNAYNKVLFRQSYRAKDKSADAKRSWIILNVENTDGFGDSSPVQARFHMEKSGDSCKILSFETKTGWEKAE